MQVVIYSQLLKSEDIPHVQQLFDLLATEGFSTYVYGPYLEEIRPHIVFKRDVGIFESHIDFRLKRFDMLITLGGDGTILKAATLIRDSGIPILGINLGRLGFLARVEKTKLEDTLRLLARGRFETETRDMIYLESNIPLFNETPYALNDFTLLKRDTSSMITIHTYINGAYLNSYWADGIIVATPTGSTGYSLSCGGPIVFPGSGNFVITPVAPHNLNVRPIVISDDSVVSFEIEGRAENFLCTLDSRFETITSAHSLAVRKNAFGLNLVKLAGITFMDTLRSKLAWGEDRRNH
ncbi:NAD kinase [Neolewinella lacunae]|uniref:NAD kinase n=1 Tax=Neolewinella lacunae TaxID=1517758 RepID=A0A923PSS7_9BACT|nr:NAD kinase [Neolewinella lacunae]MBC6996829.1 NAD kinase [Neolewinella lacunae]MDN3633807.1 NAD kinase [Neolewinella lacunae]